MKINAKEFRNNDITVTYNPSICTLCGKCAKELSDVFSNTVIPWIDINGASTEKIIQQVNKCPSGALNFYHNKKEVA